MEQESAAVLAELDNTICLAEQYMGTENLDPEVLISHLNALEEDIQAVLQQKADDPMIAKPAKDMERAARRTKREIERILPAAKRAHAAQQRNKQPSVPTTIQDVKKEEDSRTSMKLPPCQLPIFAGDPAKFDVFYETFQATVVNNKKVPHMAKWLYLKACLTGKALELIKGQPQSSDMFEIALQILQNAYGDKERIIFDYYQKIQDLPGSEDTEEALRRTYSQLEGMLLGLERMKHDIQNNEYIRAVYIGKFPKQVNFFTVKRGMPLQQIRENINEYIMSQECAIRQRVEPKKSGTTSQDIGQGKKPTTEKSPTKKSEKQPSKCLFCSELHWSDECTKLTTAAERKKSIPDRCPKCIRPAHPGDDCPRRRRCVYCDSIEHNRALCPRQFPEKNKIMVIKERKEHWTALTGKFWTMMVQVSTKKAKHTIRIRAMLDPGSSRSFISRVAAAQLDLETSKRCVAHLSSVGAADVGTAIAAESRITISTRYGTCADLGVFVIEEIVDDVPAPDLNQFKKTYPQYEALYMRKTGQGEPVNLLVGNDYIVEMLDLQNCLRIDGTKQLLATKLGWLLVASQTKSTEEVAPLLALKTDEQIKTMWDLEAIGLKYAENPETEEENKAIEIFYKNISYVNNRYEITWPWRQFPPQMNENYGLAIGRLNSLWKQLKNKPEILKEYDRIIREQLTAGIIELTEKQTTSEVIRYIPHHPIICPQKNTKLRPVYDASAKCGKLDKSLNECLMKGKKWLEDMPSLLLRIRLGATAAVADIEKAYHQIGVKPQDRDVLRFLWLKNPLRPPVIDNIMILRFCRMAFGVVSSPFLLYATITHHLKKDPSPVANVIAENMYADNLVTIIPPQIEPTHFYEKTKQLFSSMSMNLTKWATNNEQLKKHIPVSDRNDEIEQNLLGMIWNIDTDVISLKKPKIANITKLTKRSALSQLAAVFDPLGWAAPVTLTAKIFIRNLWKMNAKWDEKMSQELQNEWREIQQNLSRINEVNIPRKMFSENTEGGTITIHVFSDASKEALAMAIYAEKRKEEYSEMAFIAAKSKLTPKTELSIPRLELLAALLAARFATYIKTAMKLPIEVKTILWCDSKCVLTWITTPKIKPNAIEKQINEIKQMTITEYKYLPSEMNPADVVSRGATVDMLKNTKWWEPPRWLANKETWPQQTSVIDQATAEKEIALLLVEPEKKQKAPKYTEGLMGIQITKYSSLTKLLKVTARCFKALNGLIKKEIIEVEENEIKVARKYWIRWDQRSYYPEYDELIENIPRRIRNIRIFLDHDRIIRCQSRLQNAQISPETITPILLMNGSHLTKLIILKIHIENKHVAAPHVLAILRKNYHLPKGRREIGFVINKHCFICRKYMAKTYATPPPAPLPEFRVSKGTRPFTATRMDIFGPFQVRVINKKSSQLPKEKRWVIIFTCATIRAVHLEVIQDMTASEIADAMRRFMARRGTPKVIICDNAPQFHVLQGRFVNLWRTLKKDERVNNLLARNEIEFKFLPQDSPWMGGLYERIIKDIKMAMERTYGRTILCENQFVTSICEIEAVINSCPLVYVDKDKEAPILTPNDFLAAKYSPIDLPHNGQDESGTLAHLWHASQARLNEFWDTWSSSYLMRLRERDNQLKGSRNRRGYIPSVGELVLIAEPEKRRSSWQMARIIRLIPSADGVIRSVLLQLPKGDKTIRPIIKVAPLKIEGTIGGVPEAHLSDDRQNLVVALPEGAQEGEEAPEQLMEEIVTVYPNKIEQ